MNPNIDSKTNLQWHLINVNTKEKTVINKAVMIVGRQTTADILCKSTLVSRDHARFLLLADGTLHLEDKKSTNGVFVNRTRIEQDTLHNINDNDEIGFGICAEPEIVEQAAINYKGQAHYVYIAKVQKMDDVIVIEDSDDESDSQTTKSTSVNTECIKEEIQERLKDNDNNINQRDEEVVSSKIDNELLSSNNPAVEEISAITVSTNNTNLIENSKACNDEKNCSDIDKNDADIKNSETEKNGIVLKDVTVQLSKIDEYQIKSNTRETKDEIINIEIDMNNLQDMDDDFESDVMNEEVNENEIVEPTIKSEPLEEPPAYAKPHYDMVDSYIVITDDDDDDDNSMVLSQVFETNPRKNDENIESALFTIKKELEQLDKTDFEKSPILMEIDSDSDESTHMNSTQDLIRELESAIEEADVSTKNLKKTAPKPVSESNLSSATKKIVTKVFYKKPPVAIIEPHVVQKLTKKPTEKKTSPKTRDLRKRKNSNTEEQTKKLKISNNYNEARVDIGGLRQALDKRRSNVNSSATIDKVEKERLLQIRKTKLKEIALKPPPAGTATSSRTKTNAKVKISPSRGNFLLTELQVIPKRPKEVEVHKKPRIQRLKQTPNNVIVPNQRIDYAASLPSTSGIKNIKNYNNTNSKSSKRDVSITDEVYQMIYWRPEWVTQQDPSKGCPPVNHKPPERMKLKFSSYAEYYSIVRPLLMMEVWDYLYKDYNDRNANTFPIGIDEVISCESFLTFNCFTYYSEQQVCDQEAVKDEDLIIIQLRCIVRDEDDELKKGMRLAFAYVNEVQKSILRDRDYVDHQVATVLSEVPTYKYTFTLMIKLIEYKDTISSPLMGKVATSLVSNNRLFKSIKFLEQSPLRKFILQPKVEDYVVSNVPVTQLVSKDKLNTVQLQTVMEATHVCLRDRPGIYMIQGPPGTGKTTVVINIVQQILFGQNKPQKPCILLVAPSNGAVDQLVLRITKVVKPRLPEWQRKAIKLVRIGPKNSIHPAARSYTLEEMTRRHMTKELEGTEEGKKNSELLQRIAMLEAQIKLMRGNALKKIESEIQQLSSAREKIFRQHRNYDKSLGELLCGANIICTTLSSCMSRIIIQKFKECGIKITCCIVDEATQSVEQETLIPLMLNVKKLVLVGDPKQLSPTTLCMEAKELGYGNSLFNRIYENFKMSQVKPIKMLNIQYRMHPEICRFPNMQYYDGKLISRTKSDPLYLNKLKPYLVFNVVGESDTHNYQSNDEVDFVRSIVLEIMNVIGDNGNHSIGIITPYNNQKFALNKMLKTISVPRNITAECNTVDGFQGQEKDIIIISCVRNTPNSFLSDPKRMNVALTRAKHVLYIIGNNQLFWQCDLFGKLKKDAVRRKLLYNITEGAQNRLSSFLTVL